MRGGAFILTTVKAGSHMSCDKERRVRLHREGGPKIRLRSKDLR
jgi:hypothetical protein